MSEVPSTTTQPPARRRRVWIALGIALVAGGVFWVKVWQPAQLSRQHRMVQARIEKHLMKAMREVESGPLRNEPDLAQVCEQFIVAIHNQVANRLWYRKNVYPEKFAALADRLEAGQGPDLRTFEGCVQLVRLLDEVSPVFHGDEEIAHLHTLLGDLKIPPSPSSSPKPGS